MSKEQKIIGYLNNQLWDFELVNVWNYYCVETIRACDIIYNMNEFDGYYDGISPFEIATAVFNSETFTPNDVWFKVDEHTNLTSTDDPIDFINTLDLAEYIVKSDRDFGIRSIRNILEEDDNGLAT